MIANIFYNLDNFFQVGMSAANTPKIPFHRLLT
ncbi:MAG: hypothetical protein Ct9H90mP1_3070 [Methanobacteriota archaeon]|nr:MAG: hypothetical protein Ct9H90mP1_3070 [Euryarchaeota archaeon]